MRKRIVLLCMLALLPLFSLTAFAQEAPEDYFAQAFESIDEDTRHLLESIGVDGADLYALTSVSPENLLSLLRELFGAGLAEKAKLFGTCLAVIALVCFVTSFLPSPGIRETVRQIGSALTVFLLISGAAGAADACVQALRLTKNCMLTLIPVLGTVMAFSGSPVTAAGVHAAVFAFAQGAGVVFSDLIVPLTAAGAALGCAAALSPAAGLGQLAQFVNKTAAWAAGIVSGVFAAVLGVRGAVSGAADGVAAKGLRLLISGVPVVGGALSQAVSSLGGSLALVKNGAAALGVLAVVFICLPPVCSLLVYKGMLAFLLAAAQMFGMEKASAFIGVLQTVFTTLLAVLLFNAAVYITALAVVVCVKSM